MPVHMSIDDDAIVALRAEIVRRAAGSRRRYSDPCSLPTREASAPAGSAQSRSMVASLLRAPSGSAPAVVVRSHFNRRHAALRTPFCRVHQLPELAAAPGIYRA